MPSMSTRMSQNNGSPSRACDACFIRKIKCNEIISTRPGGDTRTRTGCKPCRVLRMDCTFDRPQQRRPRKSRKSSSSGVDSESAHDGVKSLGSSIQTPSTNITTTPGTGSGSQTAREILTTSVVLLEPSAASPYGAGFSAAPQKVGSQEVAELMVKDYLDLLYPLMPIVHRPTFKADVARDRADHDPVFYSLLLSIFAVVISQLPRRFLDYKKGQWFFEFNTPKELVRHLEQRIQSLRGREYFETPTVEKIAISYLLACSYGSVNLSGRMNVYWAEMWALLKALGAHLPDTYASLNFVEAQVRKKAFWLYVYSAAHECVGGPHRQSLSWNPIPDHMLFDSRHLEALMPLDLDDEYIAPTALYPQPPGEVALASGFNNLIRIFLCFMDLPDKAHEHVRTNRATTESSAACHECSHRSDDQVFMHLFERVKHVLDDVAPQFAPWRHDSLEDSNLSPDQDSVTRSDQLESIRANLQVTRLWARSLIFERLLGIYHSSAARADRGSAQAHMHDRAHWSERENSCEELLDVLYNIKQTNLEPNGISLTYKIRQVAAPLLDCPFEEHTGISRAAKRYIEKFMELLTLLDKYSFQDTQMVVWGDFDRQKRQPVSDFIQLSGL